MEGQVKSYAGKTREKTRGMLTEIQKLAWDAVKIHDSGLL